MCTVDKPGHRAVFVGDVHGMSESLEYVAFSIHSTLSRHKICLPTVRALLHDISYNPKKDKLIHCGDISAKGPRSGSLHVLSYMSHNNISGVRGNHDQKVIEWRAWIEWVYGLYRGQGREWLEMLHRRWDEAVRRHEKGGAMDDDDDSDGLLDEKKWIKKQRKIAKGWEKKFWKKVPEDWEMFGDHYQIARSFATTLIFC